MDGEENNLTSGDDSGIILTSNEQRITLNLREEADHVVNGKLEVVYVVHGRRITHGYLKEKERRI